MEIAGRAATADLVLAHRMSCVDKVTLLSPESRPLCLAGYTRAPHQIVFNYLDRQLEIGTGADDLSVLLPYCHGQLTIRDISDIARVSVEACLQLLAPLEARLVLVDAGEVWRFFHHISRNPPVFSPPVLPHSRRPSSESSDPPRDLITLSPPPTSARQTARSFAADILPADHLFKLLAEAYSRKTFNRVPSAGALFSLGISVVRLMDSTGLLAGIYTLTQDACRLVREGASPVPAMLGAACGDSIFAAPSVTTLVVSAHFGDAVAKYGNRGYRYALIEVGHVAQQVQRFCADNAIGVFEYGGFFDDAISTLLALKEQLPVLILGIGIPGSDVISDSGEANWQSYQYGPQAVTESRILGRGPSIDLPLVRVVSRVVAASSAHEGLGRGCGASLAEAQAKATSEAFERLACTALRVDQRSPAEELSADWVDPRVAYPLTQSQYEQLGLSKFSEATAVDWIAGHRVSSSSPCLVPVDYVYFGESMPQENRLYRATTSGVACHRSFAEAGRAAVLELIERDAVVRVWLAQVPLSRVPPSSLDAYTLDRHRYWSTKGELVILYAPSEYAHCVIACLFQDAYPYFSCGAAAETDVTSAAAHAVIEAECISTELRENSQSSRPLRASEVVHPFDHCRYYAAKSRASTLHWLRVMQPAIQPPNHEEDDIWRVDPVLVTMSDDDSPPVVRAIAESLVPINFGRGFVHRVHRRVSADANRATIHMFG